MRRAARAVRRALAACSACNACTDLSVSAARVRERVKERREERGERHERGGTEESERSAERREETVHALCEHARHSPLCVRCRPSHLGQRQKTHHAFVLRGGGVVQFIFSDILVDAASGKVRTSDAQPSKNRGRRDEAWGPRLRKGEPHPIPQP